MQKTTVTVEAAGQKEKENEYPMYMQSQISNRIVYMLSPGRGIGVAGCNSAQMLDVASNWDAGQFVPFKGKIIIDCK